jgi:hypothetical protein
MATLSAAGRQPLAVDLLLDCSLVLPPTVLRAAETAATVLARLSPHPLGAPAWHAYHGRFFERYGIGALVPVLDLVDPDVGLGFPAGYAGSTSAEPARTLTVRDDRLLALAQAAATERRDEIVLDDRLVAELAADDLERARVLPHLELCCQLHSSSAAAIERDDFRLAVVSVSRGVGTMTGRFLDLLPAADQHRMATAFARLAENDPDALVAQISFAPLDPVAGNVTRAPAVLPALISLGEHRATDRTVLPLVDLAVTSDGERLSLVSLSRRRRVEPTALHALRWPASSARWLAPSLPSWVASTGAPPSGSPTCRASATGRPSWRQPVGCSTPTTCPIEKRRGRRGVGLSTAGGTGAASPRWRTWPTGTATCA